MSSCVCTYSVAVGTDVSVGTKVSVGTEVSVGSPSSMTVALSGVVTGFACVICHAMYQGTIDERFKRRIVPIVVNTPATAPVIFNVVFNVFCACNLQNVVGFSSFCNSAFIFGNE
ncbi:MAG: hypothetical protein ACD_48C00436G0001 [uncultured bacterium]|nr:MAG: hypothetical protein ACD_48C00436G0001 [uncultured bacterium]